MINGHPANNAKRIPVILDKISVSEIPMSFPVFAPIKPPNAIAPESAAKYMKMMAAMH